MNDKIFLDTNILIYAYSIDEPKKKDIVTTILQKYETIFVSTPVLNEFIHVMSKKKKLTLDDLKEVTQEIRQNFSVAIVDLPTIDKALSLALKHKYQF